MTRSGATRKAEITNAAWELLSKGENLADGARVLMRDHDLSLRQAYRYLEAAKVLERPLVVGDPKIPFTVKLSQRLVQELRDRARTRGLSQSEIVSAALEAWLARDGGRG